MFPLTPALQSLTLAKTLRFTTCWKIERTDGLIIRVTTHNGALKLPINGVIETFSPVGAMDPTARQKLSQLKERNLDVKGMYDIAVITFDDLAAGRYRSAKVTEFLCDWKYAWAGPVMNMVYYIGQTRFNGEFWEAQLNGITTFLAKEIGAVYNRSCTANLGDARCKVNLAPFTQTGAVTGVVDPNQAFYTTLTRADNFFNFGLLTFTSGNNSGIKCDVEYSVVASGGIQLLLPTPYTIQVGDTLTAVAGCNRSLSACRDQFNNIPNYRGFPTIPGTDTMMQSPV